MSRVSDAVSADARPGKEGKVPPTNKLTTSSGYRLPRQTVPRWLLSLVDNSSNNLSISHPCHRNNRLPTVRALPHFTCSVPHLSPTTGERNSALTDIGWPVVLLLSGVVLDTYTLPIHYTYTPSLLLCCPSHSHHDRKHSYTATHITPSPLS